MGRENHFSNEKLYQGTYKIVNRDRLKQQILANLDKKLILVVSCVGSGKTTLISSVIESSKLKYIWFPLESCDQEISFFLSHFISKVRAHYPHFFKDFEKRTMSIGEDHFEPPIPVASRFVNELKKDLTGRFIIVLDNYEVVNNSSAINLIVDHIIRNTSNHFTFIVCSTQTPNIHLSNLSLNNQLYQINSSEMAFELEEIRKLFAIHHINLSPKDLKLIYQKTEGWSVGLIFLLQSLEAKSTAGIEEMFIWGNGYEKILHRYFLENIFQDQSEHVQKFLCKTSLLSHLSPDICDETLGVKYSLRLLENLVDANAFTYYVDQKPIPFYRYHPLMKEFLLKRLHQDFAEEEIERLQGRLGDILAPVDPENAIRHLISAKCFSKAVDILRSIGEKMLQQCRFKSLDDIIKSIPSSFIESDPSLLYLSGRVAEIQGETDYALEYYEKASRSFKMQKEIPDVIACLSQQALTNFCQQRYFDAKDFVQNQILCLESRCLHERVTHKLITGYTKLSQLLFKLDDSKKAESYLGKANSIYHSHPEPSYHVALLECQAFKHIVQGDLVNAIKLAEEGESVTLELNLPVRLHIFYHYLALSHLHLGHFSKSLENAQKGLEHAARLGIEDNIAGSLFADLGQIQDALSNNDAAIKNLEKSLTIFQKGHNLCGRFWSNHTLYHIFLNQGDLQEAKKYLRLLLHLANEMKFPLELGLARINLANFLSLEREGERILKLVENGRYYLNRSTKRISIFFANLIAAKAYINIGNETIAESILLESLKLLEGKNFYLYGVYQERKWLPAFLERFVSKIPQCSKLLAAYQDIASGPSETRKVISRNWEYIGESKDNEKLLNLRVYSLGSFRIFIENEEIPLYKCKSKKALTLLRYLFFTHNKGCVSKDIIEELLWPDSRPKQADLNFRVTLSMLRRFLSTGEGGPKNFPNIVRKGDGFQLCLGREGWSDVDKFIDEMNLAGYKEKKEDQHEAARHYMNAEDLYKGDFLIENLYDDWCSFEREQFKNQYLHVLTKILNYYEQQHNYNEAIQYCYKILKVDPYSENIFRKLMQYYFELGYRKEVDSVFKLCQRNIEGDLEVSLSYETKELHRKLYSSLNA